jgi:hypothetical protein
MTGSRRRVGQRRGRAAILGAITAGAVMLFGAGSAQAAPVGFSATFDDAALNLTLTFDILDPPPPATMTGTVDDATGDFDVLANDFDFPPFSGEAAPGVPVTVNFTAVDPISGNLNLGTGAATTDLSTYHANVQALGGNCDYDVDLSFSTAPGSPFNGDPFTVSGTDPKTISNGILQTSWPSDYFTPDPDMSCATINGLVAGTGGIAMGNGFDLTPAAPGGGTTPTTPAKKKKCKKGFVKKKVKGKKKCVKKKKKK